MFKKRRGKSRRTVDQLKFLNLLPRTMSKDNDDNQGLSNFDACIEACDSLAATPVSEDFQDCSIYVSPDGILLDRRRSDESVSPDNEKDGSKEHENEKDGLENENEREIAATSAESQQFNSSDEYESSICLGNDMTENGEKECNGFTARGWNPLMATMAMKRAVDTME